MDLNRDTIKRLIGSTFAFVLLSAVLSVALVVCAIVSIYLAFN